MDSGDLLTLLNRAISDKEAAKESYASYFQEMNNPTLKKIVQGVLQREGEHLEILNSLKDNLLSSGNTEELAALTAEGLIRNTEHHKQHLELLRMVMADLGQEVFIADEGEEIPVADFAESDIPPALVSPNNSDRISRRSAAAARYPRYTGANRSVFNSSRGNPKTRTKKRQPK
ncbi:Ferritin-related [Syntrophomonas zehnderi OL-4]|uniref:Ferritin-related n=1 Tax=Syntrophomonas zehnderi OL-4 TaxID=690567 RepID=A0A0E3W376_9FIRM|nr:hypothetical protein [Syntrophomonas zehnderi]CFX56892.1 Ferritin-related [Syntrophomonas zehnderi OL-4]